VHCAHLADSRQTNARPQAPLQALKIMAQPAVHVAAALNNHKLHRFHLRNNCLCPFRKQYVSAAFIPPYFPRAGNPGRPVQKDMSPALCDTELARSARIASATG